jgi:uncharacterized lipoprotein
MSVNKALARRRILLPASATLLAILALAGCQDDTKQLQPLEGNRESAQAQRDIEIPPGIQKSAPKPASKNKGN